MDLLQRSANQARRVMKKLPWRKDAVVPRTMASREHWQKLSQEGEFRFHKRDRWRHSSAFMEQSERLFRHFGFEPDDYAGKVVIDLGAGSKLRSKFFKNAHLVVIEPLADRFMAEIEGSDLHEASEVHSRPAEQLIDSLVGKADLVVSINVLDHCFDFPQIVSNIQRYLKPDGLAFLSFDMHAEADDMHPLSLTQKKCAPIFAKAGFVIEKVTTGMGEVLGGSQTYGHGPYTLNYWLRPATKSAR
jgi:SAM-dependent methyltransferase